MTEMSSRYPNVTVVVTQRERFSFTRESLASIYEMTPGLTNLVYVDGGSPKEIRRILDAEARRRGFRLIRTAGYLSPSQARNIGLRAVTTKYVVFVDNDVLVEPKWLDALVACAEETGATIVGPLYLIAHGERRSIHMAGGVANVVVGSGGARTFETRHFLADEPLPLAGSLQRGPCSLVEFHTMLVRTGIFTQIGELDEGLLSLEEHTDLCLLVGERGGTIYCEPASRITYVVPKQLALSDVSFFLLRWSERWNRDTARHFCKKWNLDASDPTKRELISYGRRYRLRALRLVRERDGSPLLKRLYDRILTMLERCCNSLYTWVWFPSARKAQ